MKSLYVPPVFQTGHNCKITAIAMLDAYYGQFYRFKPLKLHKSEDLAFWPVPSVRQISKQFGSRQGELLEVKQIVGILNHIGYESNIIDCENNIGLFETVIIDNLSKRQPVMVFFALDRETGLPTNYINGRSNEHAALITGYDKNTKQVQIFHQEEAFIISLDLLFSSTSELPLQRNSEIYKSIKSSNPIRKYELIEPEDDLTKNDIRKSIEPKPKTGFRAKLIVTESFDIQKILNCRKDFGYNTIDNTIYYSSEYLTNSLFFVGAAFDSAIHYTREKFFNGNNSDDKDSLLQHGVPSKPKPKTKPEPELKLKPVPVPANYTNKLFFKNTDSESEDEFFTPNASEDESFSPEVDEDKDDSFSLK